MRQKRAKAYRKLMGLYTMSFGFRQPYQVLVDSHICASAIDTKFDLPKQLAVVLHGTVKPMITQCSIHELYLQGRSRQPAVDLAKTFERRKCNHKEPIPGDSCLLSVIGDSNKHRYVIATQSQPLRLSLRRIPGVPIIHINRSVMVLEPPSDATIKAKETTEEQTLHPSSSDIALAASTVVEPNRKKKRGPKGPNPLSVKKKKVNTTPAQKDKIQDREIYDRSVAGEKRKRDSSDGGDDSCPSQQKKRRRRKNTHSTVPNVDNIKQ